MTNSHADSSNHGRQDSLGSLASSERLIFDLYIDLRRKIAYWASITKQTAQARMGYVGQHLVSVVTGYPGGKSGARGRDIIISEDEYGEIKTCYRVDQLGTCKVCGAKVASIELTCPKCGSDDIDRKDDSKWLIGIRNDEEFASILNPKYYYLVLFEFVDISNPVDIRASIWQVDPKDVGFAYCMIDYYLNIRAKSKSKAPFNLWPYSLKFYLMKPTLIYRSYIDSSDRVRTEIFPGRDNPILEPLPPLGQFARSRNLTLEKVRDVAKALKIPTTIIQQHQQNKKQLLEMIESFRGVLFADSDLVEAMAHHFYWDKIQPYLNALPKGLQDHVKARYEAYTKKFGH